MEQNSELISESVVTTSVDAVKDNSEFEGFRVEITKYEKSGDGPTRKSGYIYQIPEYLFNDPNVDMLWHDIVRNLRFMKEHDLNV